MKHNENMPIKSKKYPNSLYSKSYNMNQKVKLGGSAFALLSLSACGGGTATGGGGGGGPVITPPPAPPAPTTSTFQLISAGTYVADSNLPGTFNRPLTSEDLTITGLGGDDTITTGSGEDVILGGGGNDTIDAGAGFDLVAGGSGSDDMDGGDGFDWLAYGNSPSAVNVNLATGIGTGGNAEGDTFTNFELVLGSVHNDTLTGDDGLNYFEGGGGQDVIDGGLGFDLVTYYGATSGVTVNLVTEAGSGNDAAGDSYSAIEGAVGGNFNDTLIGDENQNEFYGMGGHDTLSGAGEDDYLNGGTGNDTINGGDGDDLITGGPGGDTIDGGAGEDWLDYSNSAAGVNVNLATNTVSGGDADGDTIVNMENVDGSELADTITGDANDNEIDGWGGLDTISAGGGDDRIYVYEIDGSEEDTIDGGDGEDQIDFIGQSETVAYGITLGSLNATNIERLRMGHDNKESVSLSAQDVIDVTDADNTLIIMAHDTDAVSTGSVWTYNQDEMIEGEIYHNFTSGGATLYIYTEVGTLTGFPAPAASFTETSANVYDAVDNNNSTFSNEHDDANQTANGKGGDDLIATGDGDDIINGGDGADSLRGNAGTDILNGDAGDDILIFDADNTYNGGADADTLLIVDEGNEIDLSTIVMTNMEIVDITGTGDNDLTLVAQDVLDSTAATNLLIIDGDAGDTVTSTGQTWVQGADAVIGTETYNVYTSSGATLLIDEDIGQTIN